VPYCQKCGAELKGDETFCSVCGASVTGAKRGGEARVRKTDGTKILLFVVGGFITLIAVGLLLGGGAIFWVNTRHSVDGFITTSSHPLTTVSYAMAFQHLNIEVGDVVGDWSVWRPSPGDFVTIRITVSSNNLSKNVFIGIATASDAMAYLSDVEYDELTQFSMSSSQTLEVEYTAHSGDTIPSTPTTQTIWMVSRHGVGTQTLEWSPEAGNYWIVLMNEDGSKGIASTISLGAKIPILSTLGPMLLAGGIIALILGGIIIYFGIRR
jgi:hypothetical protein